MSAPHDIAPASRPPVYDEQIDEKYDDKNVDITPVGAEVRYHLDSSEEANVKQ
jgi:hypothetical protein